MWAVAVMVLAGTALSPPPLVAAPEARRGTPQRGYRVVKARPVGDAVERPDDLGTGTGAQATSKGGAHVPSLDPEDSAAPRARLGQAEPYRPSPATRASTLESSVEPSPFVPQVPRFGVLLDAGVPSGAAASLTARPASWLRLHAGVSTLSTSTGFLGGLTFEPFRWAVRPTLTLEAGHMPRGNGRWFLEEVNAPSWLLMGLTGLEYDHASGQLGLDLGSESFAVFLRAGVSYLWARVSLPDVGTIPLALPLPCAKVGLAVFFW